MEASSKARVLQEDAGRQMDEEVQGHILSSLFQGQNRINPYLILRVRRAQGLFYFLFFIGSSHCFVFSGERHSRAISSVF